MATSHVRDSIGGGDPEAFGCVLGVCLLVDVVREGNIIVAVPGKGGSEEEVDVFHEVYDDFLGEEFAKRISSLMDLEKRTKSLTYKPM